MAPRPYTLIAELTYRCPLGCAYCSNPVNAEQGAELPTPQWERVLREAEALGVVHVHFTGGEPLLRNDLETLISTARATGLYTNLVTSGVPLSRERLAGFTSAGLDHLQLSIQGADTDAGVHFARSKAHPRKLDVARWAKELGLALTLNVVLHRGNIENVELIIDLALELGAERLELANAQYLGWALANRAALLPSASQIARARFTAARARERLEGTLAVSFVLPDYHASRPRACMEGWGRRYILVNPGGLVLPCHAAHTLPGFTFEDVAGGASLAHVWEHSPALAAFRGEEWMQDPCRSCAHRAADFGGCRCQAYHLTGDAAAADPACPLSRDHHLVEEARNAAEASKDEGRLVPLRFRALSRTSEAGPSTRT
jgi:pyrroloquinoline quinone biosynthesis protein E